MAYEGVRLVVSGALGKIYIARIKKGGNQMAEARKDVSSDFYKAVIDKFLGPENKDQPKAIETSINDESGNEYILTIRQTHVNGKELV
jgi:hypothetical protein